MEDKMFHDIMESIISNASIEEIEIIREKLNNHLINHIYDERIQEELSNDFDSSFCPHCQSGNIVKYGKDKKGNQRFKCLGCSKTFSVKTGSLLSYTKKEAYQWYLFIESLFHGDTIKQSADICGICKHTSFVWRHKILSICASFTDKQDVLQDIVYLDEKLIPVNHKGISNKEPKVSKRGISDQKRNIACAIDNHGKKIIVVSERGRIHSKELYTIYKDSIPSSCTVVSDSLRSYHKLMKDLKVSWIKIPSKKKEQDGYTLNKINLLHSSIELFLHKYRGISDKYLRNYIGLYKIMDKYPRYYKNDVINELFRLLVNSLCTLKFDDFNNELLYSWLK